MCVYCCYFFFFKQKTAYEMRISDWSSDVCSSDLEELRLHRSIIFDAAMAVDMVGCHIEENADIRREARREIDLIGRHLDDIDREIGRASCRERVCQYV